MQRSHGAGGEPENECQSLYADWLGRREEGAAEEFDVLCAAHPKCAAELRKLHGLIAGLRELLGAESTVEAGASAGAARTAPFDELLARLARRRPAESRYEERDELGRGGMGSVIEVFDLDLRRSLAKKVMLADGTRASETAHFQLWYRDAAAGRAGFNLTNGLAVTFCE